MHFQAVDVKSHWLSLLLLLLKTVVFTALIPEMLNVLKIMSYNITHVVFMPKIGRTKNNAKPHNTFKSINITEVVEVCQKHTLHCQNDSDWLAGCARRVEMPHKIK